MPDLLPCWKERTELLPSCDIWLVLNALRHIFQEWPLTVCVALFGLLDQLIDHLYPAL